MILSHLVQKMLNLGYNKYTVTISNLLNKAYKILEHVSQTPELDTEVVLAHVLDQDKAYLISHSEDDVDLEQEEEFIGLINRRAEGEPIAYLTGKKEFYGLDYFVNKHVLIPRPETEQLVELVFEEVRRKVLRHGSGQAISDKLGAKSNKREIRIIDVGTGSGNIGITLLNLIIKNKLNKKVKFVVYMTDISGKALRIAEKNYKNLIPKRANIKALFIKADLLKGFNSRFNIIVSNPPYIPSGQIDLLDKNVKDFEPHLALSGGELGMKFIRDLISQGTKRLAKSGKLFIEIHEDLPERIKLYIEENFPNWTVVFEKDVFGEWRFAIISK